MSLCPVCMGDLGEDVHGVVCGGCYAEEKRLMEEAEAEREKMDCVFDQIARVFERFDGAIPEDNQVVCAVELAMTERDTLRDDNDRLREALEFYARLKNWARTGPQWDQEMSPAEKDKGAIAANTLAQKPGCRSEKIEAPEVPASEAP